MPGSDPADADDRKALVDPSDVLRHPMTPAGTLLYPLGVDLGILTAVTVGLIVLCAAFYPRMAQ